MRCKSQKMLCGFAAALGCFLFKEMLLQVIAVLCVLCVCYLYLCAGDVGLSRTGIE